MGKKRGKQTKSPDEKIGLTALLCLLADGSITDIEDYVVARSSPFTDDERSVLGFLYLNTGLDHRDEAARKLGVTLTRLREIEASAIKKLQDRFGAA
jgi:DNA-directed RNA polymerase sigma subunit (sigma70/sigma32)